MATKTSSKKTGGFLGGFLLVIGGIMVLWFNEGRTVKTQSAINEALKNYKDVTSKKVDSSNDGKVIATTGKIDLSNSAELKDSKFGISVKAAKLKRVVEMYQWNESCETDEDDKETCKYEKDWSNKSIDSSEFKKADHDNPAFKFEGEEFEADNVKVGAFDLSDRLLGNLSYNKEIKNETLTTQYVNPVDGFKVDGKYLINSEDLSEPQIGDVRVSYEYAGDGTVSLLGVQNEDTIRAFTGKKGKSILIVRRGDYSGRELLESETSANKGIKWFLRILGTIVVIGGISNLFSPLQNLTKKIPVVSNLVNLSASLVSTVVGLAVSLVVIAIAWFRFRPVLSIILIAIVVALAIFLKYKESIMKKVNKK